MCGESISFNFGVLNTTWFTDIISNEVVRIHKVIHIVDGHLRLAIGQECNVFSIQEEGECIIECWKMQNRYCKSALARLEISFELVCGM